MPVISKAKAVGAEELQTQIAKNSEKSLAESAGTVLQ